jgi:RimJ/RimL family protein N-acetyltransferase
MLDLQPVLNGKLLTLRPLLKSDFDELYLAASDPQIWEQHPEPLRYKEEVFQKYFDSGLECKGAFVITDSKTGKIIGSSRFYDYSEEKEEITIGFTFLKKEYWGGLYNKELKDLMITHAFTKLEKIFFVVGEKNLRSQKAMAKIGARQEEIQEKTSPEGLKSISLIYAIKKQ